MADPVIINERRHQAQDRLLAACAKLAEAEGVPPPQKPMRLNADAAFQSMQDLEGLADFVESVNAKRLATENELQAVGKPSRKSVSSTK